MSRKRPFYSVSVRRCKQPVGWLWPGTSASLTLIGARIQIMMNPWWMLELWGASTRSIPSAPGGFLAGMICIGAVAHCCCCCLLVCLFVCLFACLYGCCCWLWPVRWVPCCWCCWLDLFAVCETDCSAHRPRRVDNMVTTRSAARKASGSEDSRGTLVSPLDQRKRKARKGSAAAAQSSVECRRKSVEQGRWVGEKCGGRRKEGEGSMERGLPIHGVHQGANIDSVVGMYTLACMDGCV